LRGYHTFYANTDGITLKVKEKDVEDIQKITREFDKITGLEMEYNFFKRSHIRDVNNFINITDDGSVKAKGAFAGKDLEKNPVVPIVFEAIRLYLQDGTPIEKTIKGCKKMVDFCTSRSVTGGAMYAKSIPEMYPEKWEASLIRNKRITKTMVAQKEKLEATWVKNNGNYLGKVVRFYYSRKGYTLHYKKSGNLVPMTKEGNGVKPLMDMKKFKKIKDDINFEWYIQYGIRMLKDLGVDYAISL